MRAIETRPVAMLDRFTENRGHALELRKRGIVGDSHFECDAPLLHPLEVADAALKQIGVGEHDQLAIQAAHVRGLESYVLDGAAQLAHNHEIADHERLVERDRQRGEQVAEDVLYRERNGHPADSQSRNEGGDVELEVIEYQQT